MKAQLIQTLIAAVTVTACAQEASVSSAAPRGTAGPSATISSGRSSKSTTDFGTAAEPAANPPPAPEGGVVGEMPYRSSSSARFGSRLNTIVQRASPAAGSIILSSPLPQKEMDELAEDLNVLGFIFGRNVQRAFGEETTEYKLGVPITMRDNRLVEISYIQDLGVLVKIHVPFPVVPADDAKKKTDSTPAQDTEWEKARRTLYGGDDPGARPGPVVQEIAYDERLVTALKKQMFEALKNAANLRHVGASQSITVAVLGGPNVRGAGVGMAGAGDDPTNISRQTALTIRITKSQADAASGDPKGSEDLSKSANITAYFDTATATASTRGNYGVGGGYGSAFGTGYGYTTQPAGNLPLAR